MPRGTRVQYSSTQVRVPRRYCYCMSTVHVLYSRASYRTRRVRYYCSTAAAYSVLGYCTSRALARGIVLLVVLVLRVLSLHGTTSISLDTTRVVHCLTGYR